MKRMIKKEEKRERGCGGNTLIPFGFCYSVISGLIRDPELEVTNCDLKMQLVSDNPTTHYQLILFNEYV